MAQLTPTMLSLRSAGARTPVRYRSLMAIPQPGDLSPGFFVQEGRCFRLIYSTQLQSTHCREAARWRGRWTDGKGRVHRVWACEGHAEGLDGVRWAA